MDLELEGRVYIVTGASRGLGRAAAGQLVAEGAKVVVSGRNAKAVAAAAAELGEGAVGVGADNADPSSAGRLIGAAREHFGRLDGLLISVDGPPQGRAGDITDDQWEHAFSTIFLGAMRLARAVAGQLRAGGVIGFVLSSTAHEPAVELTVSSGLRPGLAGYAKTLANELGPRGIRVVGLLPARLDTERVRELDAHSGDTEAARERHSAEIPLGRYGRPEEFGKAAAFLLSPAASYLTGVMLPVDGGALRGF